MRASSTTRVFRVLGGAVVFFVLLQLHNTTYWIGNSRVGMNLQIARPWNATCKWMCSHTGKEEENKEEEDDSNPSRHRFLQSIGEVSEEDVSDEVGNGNSNGDESIVRRNKRNRRELEQDENGNDDTSDEDDEDDHDVQRYDDTDEKEGDNENDKGDKTEDDNDHNNDDIDNEKNNQEQEQEQEKQDDKYNHSSSAFFNDSPTLKCAEWIPPERRKILLVGMPRIEDYRSSGGEQYVGACLDYALRQLGFEVYHADPNWLEQVEAGEEAPDDRDNVLDDVEQYYRIFHNAVARFPQLFTKVACRARFFAYWGSKDSQLPEQLSPEFHVKQVVTPHPDPVFSSVGYFPLSLVTVPPQHRPEAHREKVGMILGKSPYYFAPEPARRAIEALLEDGFELHSTCRDNQDHDDQPCLLPEGVIRHSDLNAGEFGELQSRMAFMLGLGNPLASPSPLEGLSRGVAFLNPISSPEAMAALRLDGDAYAYPWKFPPQGGRGTDHGTQHDPLAALGMPYVYNIPLEDSAAVVQAARWAVEYRFSSYIPWEYTPDAMIRRVCNSFLEDDSLCLQQQDNEDDDKKHSGRWLDSRATVEMMF